MHSLLPPKKGIDATLCFTAVGIATKVFHADVIHFLHGLSSQGCFKSLCIMSPQHGLVPSQHPVFTRGKQHCVENEA
jgi:hypothetical protein